MKNRIYAAILYYFYLGLLYLFFPIFFTRAILRQRHYPKNWGRLKERLGFFSLPLLNQPIWIHAVSYGEAVLAEQLVEVIRASDLKRDLVITTTTCTGSERIQKGLGETVFHVYLPYDLPSFVQRFIQKVKPKILIILETELWPALIKKTHQAGIPIFLANARLSEKSAQQYRMISPLIQDMLYRFSCVAAQAEGDAKRFFQLGCPSEKLEIMGSIKYDRQLNESIIKKGKKIKHILGESRVIWVAGSTHAGEEEQILTVFNELKSVHSNTVLILVPRHPERFDEVARLCAQTGHRWIRRSASSDVLTETDILLGDTLGELLLFYTAADIAFVGGSLVSVGGHNVLEPVAAGVPTLIGPYFYHFTEIVTHLSQKQAIQVVETPQALLNQILLWIKHPLERIEQAKRAWDALEANRGALGRHLSKLTNILVNSSN